LTLDFWGFLRAQLDEKRVKGIFLDFSIDETQIASIMFELFKVVSGMKAPGEGEKYL
jgi:hypothetical protein